MSESKKHAELVKVIINKLKKIIPQHLHVFVASEEIERRMNPPIIGGFIPDVYYNFNGLTVIGEAKSARDIDNNHTKKQIEAYVNFLINTDGQKLLIIAAPWKNYSLIKNIVQKIMKEKGANFKFEILDDII